MQTLADTFFSMEEQQKITRTVQQVEEQTTGEVVPMVVAASHSYPEAELTGALVLTVPLALSVAYGISSLLWWPGNFLWVSLLGMAFFFPLSRWIVRRSPWLLRLFLRGDRADAEVERSAFISFYSEGLHATREATGVLIYISILERRVWILGDHGINEHLPPHIWQDFVSRLVTGIRKKQQCEALCAVIEEIGGLLHTHFPPKADDRNELSDLMIMGRETSRRSHGLRIQ
jgi:putative membrane protein